MCRNMNAFLMGRLSLFHEDIKGEKLLGLLMNGGIKWKANN